MSERRYTTADFDYELPEELIAQAPAEPRDSCRLLVVHRDTGEIEHRRFTDILEYLDPGDLLVANETRVLPARLLGNKEQTGGLAEVLLLKRREDLDAAGSVWECLVSPGRRLRQGARIEFREGGAQLAGAQANAADALPADGTDAPVVLHAEILDFVEESRGGRLVRFEPAGSLTLDEAIHAVGHVPLPPYITSYTGSSDKYQTVYATNFERSAAAPTAGLHFTPELLDRVREQGTDFETLELEVGIDTFRIVEEDDPKDHVMHTERYTVPEHVVDAVYAAKARGGRTIAVGTTSVRSLESAWEAGAADGAGREISAQGFAPEPGALLPRELASTNLYLMPGSTFHVVDALITNFHVPRSTLMMLVSAFAGHDLIMRAYGEAVREGYRFLSFGDAMLIL